VKEMKLTCDNAVARLRFEAERARLKLDQVIKAPPRGSRNSVYSRAEVRIFIDRAAHGVWPHLFHRGGDKLSKDAMVEIRSYFAGKVEPQLVEEFIAEWNERHRE
jgi:hypothetical protein